MILKSSKSNAALILVLASIALLSCFFLFYIGGTLPALFLTMCSLIILISYSITIGRTILIDASGYTVTLGKYRRKYLWNGLAIRRLEPPHLGLRLPYHNGGVFFSPKKVKKPKIMDPTLYCMLFHPLSCFYAYFVTPAVNVSTGAEPGIYEVDKEQFMSLMDRWGIEIDEV